MSICTTFGAIGVDGLVLARTYAVGYRNTFGITAVTTTFFIFESITVALIPFQRCTSSFLPQNPPVFLDILTVVSLTLFELGVLIVVLGHTWRVYHKDIGGQTSFMGLFIYQGIIRFSIIFIWTVVVVVMSETLRASLSSVVQPLGEATSVILICRFFLQLAKRGTFQHPQTPSMNGWTTMYHSFHHVIGDIGASIREDMGDRIVIGETSVQGDRFSIRENNEASTPGHDNAPLV